MAQIIACDNGCGRELPLPTTEEAAAGWRRLSLRHNDRLHFRYVCPHCPDTRVRENLERLRLS